MAENLRTFKGESYREAFAKVKSEMGRDAVILHTREAKRGGFMGLFGKQVVEITASDGYPLRKKKGTARPASRTQPKAVAKRAPSRQILDTYRAIAAAKRIDRVSPSVQPVAPKDGYQNEDIKQIKSMLQNLMKQHQQDKLGDIPEELLEFYLHLVENEVVEDLARGLIEKVTKELHPDQLHDKDLIRSKLLKNISRLISVSGPIQVEKGSTKVIAVIGPTGVGKTTTIAKLAANFRLKQKVQVGLITVDTYRIAAVEQLKTYAGLLGLPVKVVLSPAELEEAIVQLSFCDVILIDTAGRSHRDYEKMDQLKEFLKAAKPDETHLVVSSASEPAYLRKVIAQFSSYDVKSVILSKLDDAINTGLILNVFAKVNQSLSYITTGQNVPYDIEEGDSERIARMILEGVS